MDRPGSCATISAAVSTHRSSGLEYTARSFAVARRWPRASACRLPSSFRCTSGVQPARRPDFTHSFSAWRINSRRVNWPLPIPVARRSIRHVYGKCHLRPWCGLRDAPLHTPRPRPHDLDLGQPALPVTLGLEEDQLVLPRASPPLAAHLILNQHLDHLPQIPSVDLADDLLLQRLKCHQAALLFVGGHV